MSSHAPTSAEKVHQLLRGFPESTVQACLDFQTTRSAEAFDRAFRGIIEYHLREKPTGALSALPGTTKLVADLGLDSLTMVEMAFLFEDLFAAKVPHEEYVKVETLDDLRTLLWAKVNVPPAA